MGYEHVRKKQEIIGQFAVLTSVKPSVSINSFLRGCRIIQISCHNLRALDAYLSMLHGTNGLAIVDINNLKCNSSFPCNVMLFIIYDKPCILQYFGGIAAACKHNSHTLHMVLGNNLPHDPCLCQLSGISGVNWLRGLNSVIP